jgi:hypothetical protein
VESDPRSLAPAHLPVALWAGIPKFETCRLLPLQATASLSPPRRPHSAHATPSPPLSVRTTAPGGLGARAPRSPTRGAATRPPTSTDHRPPRAHFNSHNAPDRRESPSKKTPSRPPSRPTTVRDRGSSSSRRPPIRTGEAGIRTRAAGEEETARPW